MPSWGVTLAGGNVVLPTMRTEYSEYTNVRRAYIFTSFAKVMGLNGVVDSWHKCTRRTVGS
jgi:hypothetical protein